MALETRNEDQQSDGALGWHWLEAGDQRVSHPKAYLSWLCQEPTDKKCSRYDETKGGAEALAKLDWSALLGDPVAAPFARAMIHDIAEALGVEAPFPGEVAPSTARSELPAAPALRNL